MYSFQERLLSRRRIVFLNDFILFQCPQMTVRDDIHANDNTMLINVRFRERNEAGLSFGDFTDPETAYKNAVHTFCTREMRDRDDVLRAFARVASFLGTLIGTQVICGLLKDSLLDTLC